MPFGQLLFDQSQQMPIARHHINAGLLLVSRCVTDIDSQRKLGCAFEARESIDQ
jgi:hypothetical protein